MQPELPNLPPMQPAAKAAAPSSSSAAPMAATAGANSPAPRGSRLRQMASIIAGGGLGIVILIAVGELTLRPELKPTTILATIEAQTDLSTINQKLGVAPGTLTFTEDEYREKIANAERSGQAKAELAFQKDLAVVQADKERVVGAYQTLYQRTNIIAQAGVQMEAVAQQFRQRLVEQTNGGRAVIISIYDGLCAIGDAGSCESARNARAGMIEEAGKLTEGDLARKVQELMAGIPDPASLVANRDVRENGPPAFDR
jgi:hypothetical protein